MCPVIGHILATFYNKGPSCNRKSKLSSSKIFFSTITKLKPFSVHHPQSNFTSHILAPITNIHSVLTLPSLMQNYLEHSHIEQELGKRNLLHVSFFLTVLKCVVFYFSVCYQIPYLQRLIFFFLSIWLNRKTVECLCVMVKYISWVEDGKTEKPQTLFSVMILRQVSSQG